MTFTAIRVKEKKPAAFVGIPKHRQQPARALYGRLVFNSGASLIGRQKIYHFNQFSELATEPSRLKQYLFGLLSSAKQEVPP